MAGQSYWGNSGDATHAEIVNPKLAKEIFTKTSWKTLVGRLNGGRYVKTQTMRFGRSIDIGNSSIIQEKSVTEGNEFRMTLMEDLEGMPGGYGDSDVVTGDFTEYKHSKGWINQIDSKAWQLPGRCSQKQAKSVITDPKGDLMAQMTKWTAQEIDYEFVRAALLGASRNLLLSTNGGLGVTLPGASAGQFRSCYHFYVPGTGLVSASRTRATHEAAVATALDTLANSSTYHFGLTEHDKVGNICEQYYKEEATIGGSSYKTIAVVDRALLWRLFARGGDLETLMKYARERAKSNPALNHMDAYDMDGVLYIPYRGIESFRPSTSGGLPVYGCGLDSDPRSYSNSSKIALGMFMGAKSFLRGKDMSWNVTMKQKDHQKGWEYACHWDDGFVRNEWDAKDGRTEMENPHMFIGAWYDAGIGTAIGS